MVPHTLLSPGSSSASSPEPPFSPYTFNIEQQPTRPQSFRLSGKNQAASESEDLPRSLSDVKTDPRKDLRDIVNNILSDRFMGFVALLLIPIIVLPIVTDPPASVTTFLYVSDWTIITIFVVEYASKLYLSQSRRDYFVSRWHL